MLNGAGSGSGGYQRGLASYPAAPAGMLLDSSPSWSRKTTAKWARAEQRLSVAGIALGACLVLASLRFAYNLTQWSGMLLGALLMASGAAGYWGGVRRSPNFTSLHLVGCLLGALLALTMIGEVARDAQVDCALAELYERGRATEKALASLEAEELHATVFRRLSEMEELMGHVQAGAAKQAELRQAQEQLRATDTAYIRHKVDMLKSHAQQLLNGVLKSGAVTEETIGRLSEEEKDVLRRRVEMADRILGRIADHHGSKEEELSAEEYEEILHDLTDADVVPADTAASPELSQAKRELPNMAAALQRSKADAYHTLQVGGAHHELSRMQAEREARRQRFEAQFEQLLERRKAADLSGFVANLPQHCVTETAGERLMVWAGVAAIGLQAASAFVALSLSLRLPGDKSL